MNIIKPKYEILEQQYNKETLLEDMFKHIEICGRTCYKSEDKITDASYEKFVKMLEDANHGAMLEHGTVYLTIPVGTPVDDIQYMWKIDIVSFFKRNKYSVVKEKVVNETIDVEIKGYGMKTQASATFYYITTNWRVIYENRKTFLVKYLNNNYHFDKDTLKDSVLQWMTEPTENHEKRYTVRFTYHLAVARDINRHRVQSIGEESTRYCNYSKEKFSEGPSAELNIIEPVFLSDYEKDIIKNSYEHLSFNDMCKHISHNVDKASFEAIDYWLFANKACEYAYMKLTKDFGWTAQKASLILPLDTKTCSVHTAFASDWCHFFNLRALGTTGAPRPSAKEVAWPLMQEFIDKGYITVNQINKEKYQEICNKYQNIEDYIRL
jgi:thymidylate synthase (FAD)